MMKLIQQMRSEVVVMNICKRFLSELPNGCALFLVVMFASGCSGDSGPQSFTGIVEGNSYALSSPVSDRLLDLTVKEGDRLEKGDIAGHIDSASLVLKKKAALAKMSQLEIQLEEIGLNTEQVHDTYRYYADTYRKNLELLAADAVSDQAVQDLKLNMDKWQRELQGLRLKREALRKQKEELSYTIEEIELTIAKTELTSPAEGYVDKVFYRPGEYVPALRPVLQVVSLKEVWCTIYAGEEILAMLQPGEALSARSGDSELDAVVEHINSKAEFTPKEVLTPENRKALVYGIRVGIENPRGVLKIGMPVEIILE